MMTLEEITALLVRADRLNLMTYKDGQAAAWKEVFDAEYPHLDARQAVQAVNAIATHAETIPARGIRVHDVAKWARQTSRDRTEQNPPQVPAGLTGEQELEWRRAWLYAAARGAEPAEARAYCQHVTGIDPHNVPAIESQAHHDAKQKLEELKKTFGKGN